jgi:hypothetical protein
VRQEEERSDELSQTAAGKSLASEARFACGECFFAFLIKASGISEDTCHTAS